MDDCDGHHVDIVSSPSMRHRMYTEHDEDGHDGADISNLCIAGYSVGHVLNDMCASCWFSYLLLYLRDVVELDSTLAGVVMFAGQAADGLATPLVGFFSDMSKGIRSLGLGRRKIWNLGGAIMVALCFAAVFAICLPCLVTGEDPNPGSDSSDNENGGDFHAAASMGIFTTARYLLGGGDSSEDDDAGSSGKSLSVGAKTAYYALGASFFNFGWAAVQVSHMSLVPELTEDEGIRVKLNSLRYAFTIFSNVAVFLVMYALLSFLPDQSRDHPGPKAYRYLAITVLAVGGLCTAFFTFFTKESFNYLFVGREKSRVTSAFDAEADRLSESLEQHAHNGSLNPDDDYSDRWKSKERPLLESDELREINGSAAAVKPANKDAAVPGQVQRRAHRMLWWSWFYEPMFYLVGLNYMFTRLVVNVSQVYVPFFITKTLKMPRTSVALVPLVVYVSSFVMTLLLKRVNQRMGRQSTYTLGAVLCSAASVIILVLPQHAANWMYLAAILLGAGNATIMVTSVTMEADLIGCSTESGAFVYGAMSFTDKLSNGIAVLAIQITQQQQSSCDSPEFYRYITGAIPLGSAVLAAVVTYVIKMHLFSTEQRAAEERMASEDDETESMPSTGRA